MNTFGWRHVFLIIVGIICLSAWSASAQDTDLVEKYRQALKPQKATVIKQKGQSSKQGVGGTRPGEPSGGASVFGVQGTRPEAEPKLVMNVHFAQDSDAIPEEDRRKLDALGMALKDPELVDYVYRIEGHTDSTGDASYNKTLSQRRAESVSRYLTTNYYFPPQQFQTIGYGESRPVASNDNTQGRAQNRRVVIVNTMNSLQARQPSPVVQPQPQPTEPIPPQVSFEVLVQTPNGEARLNEGATLTSRDNYAIRFTAEEMSYVYFFQEDSGGKITALFPNNQFSTVGNPVGGRQTYRIPNSDTWLFLDENQGQEHIIVLSSRDPIQNPSQLASLFLSQDEALTTGTYNKDFQQGKAQVGTMGVGGERTGVSPVPRPSQPAHGEDNLFVWIYTFEHR